MAAETNSLFNFFLFRIRKNSRLRYFFPSFQYIFRFNSTVKIFQVIKSAITKISDELKAQAKIYFKWSSVED